MIKRSRDFGNLVIAVRDSVPAPAAVQRGKESRRRCGTLAGPFRQNLQIGGWIIAVRKKDVVLPRSAMLIAEQLLKEDDIGFQRRLIPRTIVAAANREEKIGRQERRPTAWPPDGNEEQHCPEPELATIEKGMLNDHKGSCAAHSPLDGLLPEDLPQMCHLATAESVSSIGLAINYVGSLAGPL